MKHCKSCDKDKPLTDFYLKYSRCKLCVSKYNSDYMKRNRKKLLDKMHKYNTSDHGQTLLKEMKRKHRAKVNARSMLYQAIKRGDIVKPDSCEQCNRTVFLNGHHEDYAKPLDVIWLCVACHHRLHRVHK